MPPSTIEVRGQRKVFWIRMRLLQAHKTKGKHTWYFIFIASFQRYGYGLITSFRIEERQKYHLAQFATEFEIWWR